MLPWIVGAIEELLPIVLYVLVQAQVGVTEAIVVMCVATIVLVGWAVWQGVTAPKFAIVSTIALLLFAIPSIVTNDPAYFQLSDTVIDGIFAAGLLLSLLWKRSLLEYFFSSIFALPRSAWRTLTVRWGMLFAVMAGANEIIRLTQSIDIWSLYKLLSTIGILLFGLWQFRLSMRERIVSESNWLGLRTTKART